MYYRGWIRPILLVPALLSFPAPIPAAPSAEGEMWEHTTEMTAMGMTIPAQKQRSCNPKGTQAQEPPMPADGNCELKDVNISGSRVSWKVECKAPEAMSGRGEVVYSGDSYSGTMDMTSSHGDMHMKLSGKRLGTPCDPGELERKIKQTQAAAERQHHDVMAAQCAAMAEKVYLEAFEGANATCKDPAHKRVLCDTLRSEAGYLHARSYGEATFARTAAFCGAEPEPLRQELCGTALQRESFEFLGQTCPEQAQALAQRECAGRKYTALTGSKYQGFCASYAASMLAGGETAPAEGAANQPAGADAKEGAVKKAKKKLSGLFGR